MDKGLWLLTVILLLPAAAVGKQVPGVDAVSLAAIQQAQAAQDGRRAYRVEMTSRTRESTSSTLIYVAPDQYHHRETTRPGADEIVMIGGEGWLKSSGKSWEPAPFDFGNVLRHFRSPRSAGTAAGYRVTGARTLPPSDLNGASAATYEYVLVKDKETVKVTMWVTPPGNLPLKYLAETDADGTKSTDTWEIVYDDTLKVESPAAQVACRTGEQCLDFGMRSRDQRNPLRAAEFYNQACKAGTWQGCLGYASHLVNQASEFGTDITDRTRLANEAVKLLDGVIKEHPKAWRALYYKGNALVAKSTDAASGLVGIAMRQQALALARKVSGPEADWDPVLRPK